VVNGLHPIIANESLIVPDAQAANPHHLPRPHPSP
jgi:hypothetical protein